MNAIEVDKRSISFWQFQIGQWQTETFGNGTVNACAEHLRREVKEICAACELWQEHWSSNREINRFGAARAIGDARAAIGEELADAMMLLFGIASKVGVYLETEVQRKFEINKNRKWGAPDAHGVIEHIRETDTTEVRDEV